MKAQQKEKVKKETNDFLSILKDPKRFTRNSDGWIKDKLLGIEWGPSSEEVMNFEAAKKFCADNGGRLPEIHELHSLVDYTKRNPAINTEIFGDTKTNSWYWTGTRLADYKDYVWCVGFSSGYVSNVHKGNTNYVRPVRASQ